MPSATYSRFAPAPADARLLNRAVTWSVAVHLSAVVALFVVPREWLSRKEPAKSVMTISLGGTPGPTSTGTTSMGGRTVEQVAPPPKRPEPVRPAPKEVPVAAPVKAPPPRPQATAKPATPAPPKPAPPTATRPPVTGPQVVQGNTRVDTGARSQGAGLTFGGGGLGGETDLQDFCCRAYLDHLLSAIDGVWNKNQQERGMTVLKFTIQRDGSISDIVIESSSGSGVLDRAARAALQQARLLRLPAEYTKPTLTIHLTFPYGPQ